MGFSACRLEPSARFTLESSADEFDDSISDDPISRPGFGNWQLAMINQLSLFVPMLTIRNAIIDDVPVILEFIHLLAEYERAPEAVAATEEDLKRDGFGPAPKYRCVIAEWNNTAAGFAFYFYIYSTWMGRPGLYLEDLFVLPEMRGH